MLVMTVPAGTAPATEGIKRHAIRHKAFTCVGLEPVRTGRRPGTRRTGEAAMKPPNRHSVRIFGPAFDIRRTAKAGILLAVDEPPAARTFPFFFARLFWTILKTRFSPLGSRDGHIEDQVR